MMAVSITTCGNKLMLESRNGAGRGGGGGGAVHPGQMLMCKIKGTANTHQHSLCCLCAQLFSICCAHTKGLLTSYCPIFAFTKHMGHKDILTLQHAQQFHNQFWAFLGIFTKLATNKGDPSIASVFTPDDTCM